LTPAGTLGVPLADDGEERFRAFLNNFCTVSRQYSTEQMKWFRKDKAYLWVRSELGATRRFACHSSATVR
jgi:tRNA A37 N6-isopentenylltransferase MiaA